MLFEKIYNKYLAIYLEAVGARSNDRIIKYDDLKNTIIEIYNNEYKELYPDINALETVFDNLNPERKTKTVNHIISYHCKRHNIENTVEKTIYVKKLKSHPFFCKQKYACSAPFTTLRFDFDGTLSVCCINREHTLGVYPATTPGDAWFGDKLKALQNAMFEFDFSLGCQQCAHHIIIGNGTNTLLHQSNIMFPDVDEAQANAYPPRLIFQLHNTCNYECIMCSGEYSSSICKSRDGKEQAACVYDDSFIEQIKPFIEHAKQIDFLGGEPFLIPIYYKIWDLIKEINPSIKVCITTNGSIYSDRIERLLCSMPKSRVIVSIDSLKDDVYSNIRRKGSLQRVLTNIEKFIAINKMSSIAFCPIIQNVYEIPQFIKFCADRDIDFCINNTVGLIDGKELYKGLYENGVRVPPDGVQFKEQPISEFRLHTLTAEEKENIKVYLQRQEYPKKYRDIVNNFINFLINF